MLKSIPCFVNFILLNPSNWTTIMKKTWLSYKGCILVIVFKPVSVTFPIISAILFFKTGFAAQNMCPGLDTAPPMTLFSANSVIQVWFNWRRHSGYTDWVDILHPPEHCYCIRICLDSCTTYSKCCFSSNEKDLPRDKSVDHQFCIFHQFQRISFW